MAEQALRMRPYAVPVALELERVMQIVDCPSRLRCCRFGDPQKALCHAAYILHRVQVIVNCFPPKSLATLCNTDDVTSCAPGPKLLQEKLPLSRPIPLISISQCQSFERAICEYDKLKIVAA
eukprot:364667-Rhodomonas_salina.2